jgi:type III restriction enzyme
VDYRSCSELIYSLINDAKEHFLTYLQPDETEKVMRDRQRSLADFIYAQMNQHFYVEQTSYGASTIPEMNPYSNIERGFGSKFRSDDLFDYRDAMSTHLVKSRVFKGFKKACHTLYKFDSDTERTFARVLENDADVLKWMRPAPKQFSIYYGAAGISKYEPDFVVETQDKIYMVETKAANEIASEDVQEKARAGRSYCAAVSEWSILHEAKPWEYVLIAHDEVRANSSFVYLVKNKTEQLSL